MSADEGDAQAGHEQRGVEPARLPHEVPVEREQADGRGGAGNGGGAQAREVLQRVRFCRLVEHVGSVEMAPGRLLIFPSEFFHAAWHPMDSFLEFPRLTLAFWLVE